MNNNKLNDMRKAILAAAAAILMITSAACSKFDIPGTRWQATVSGQMSMGGFTATVGSHDTLTFTGENAGKLLQQPFTEAYGMVTDGESTTVDFTYTFDGSGGTITFNRKSHPFTFDRGKKELTLEVILPDEEGYNEYIQTFSNNKVSFKMY